MTAAAPTAGALRAFAATTAAVAVAGALLAVAAIRDRPEPQVRGAVGQVVGTGFGAIAVGTVTSGARDALDVAVTVTNERGGEVDVDPGRFRLLTRAGDAVQAAPAPSAPRSLGLTASATLVLRFRAPGAAGARRLEFRDPRGAPLLVDLARVAGGTAAGGGGHG